MEVGDTRWPVDVAPSPVFVQLHYTYVVGRQADDLWPLNGMLFCGACYSGGVPLDDPGGPCRSCIAVFLSETCSFRLSSSVFWDVVSSPAYVFSPGSFPPGTPSPPSCRGFSGLPRPWQHLLLVVSVLSADCLLDLAYETD